MQGFFLFSSQCFDRIHIRHFHGRSGTFALGNKCVDFSVYFGYIINTEAICKPIGKKESFMATSTFERKIEITDPESLKKLAVFLYK